MAPIICLLSIYPDSPDITACDKISQVFLLIDGTYVTLMVRIITFVMVWDDLGVVHVDNCVIELYCHSKTSVIMQ